MCFESDYVSLTEVLHFGPLDSVELHYHCPTPNAYLARGQPLASTISSLALASRLWCVAFSELTQMHRFTRDAMRCVLTRLPRRQVVVSGTSNSRDSAGAGPAATTINEVREQRPSPPPHLSPLRRQCSNLLSSRNRHAVLKTLLCSLLCVDTLVVRLVVVLSLRLSRHCHIHAHLHNHNSTGVGCSRCAQTERTQRRCETTRRTDATC
jgi:hypothetical protein